MTTFLRLLAIPLLFITLAGSGISSAQALKVRTLALRSGELPEVFLKGTAEHHPLKFSAIQPSQAVSGTKANPLPLYKSVLDAEGEESFVVAAKVTIPTGADEIILLGWRAGEKIRYVAIKDNFGAARFNNWLLINTTAKPIAFKVGEKTKPIQVAPGTSANYRITVEKNKGAAVLAQAPVNGKAKTIFSTYWPVQEGKRAVVLFVDDGKKIRVKRITDKLPAAEP